MDDRRRESGEQLTRRQASSRKRRRRRRKKKILRILTVIGITILVIAAVLGISYGVGKHITGKYMNNSNAETTVDISAEPSADAVEIVIPQGATTKDIAKLLKDNSLISNEFFFRLKCKSAGADQSFHYGTFYIDKGLTDDQIIEILKQSNTTAQNRITIPEGYTVKQIAALVDEKGIATTEDFLNEVNNGEFNYDFLEGIPDREYRLEGYLFPDTYYLSGNETARDIIVMMLDRFEQIYNTSVKPYVSSSGYTLDQLVTVASMVEAEAMLDEERPVIAGVIYNRLDIDMYLQIDATVQYANQTKNEVVTETDLSVDSPYNTYKNKGLPIGPICSPGEASLSAAVQPEKHNYYYYVLKARGGSEHVFTENYEDFLTAKAAYQATFD